MTLSPRALMTSTLTILGAEPNEAPKDELPALSIGVKQPDDDDDTAPVVENTDQAVLHDNNNAAAATADDDIKREPESASTAPSKTDVPPLPPPNALDLIAIVDQFRAALRPLEEILKQHGARMSTVEFDATVDLVADMRKSLAALELSLTDTTTSSVCEPSADSKHAPPTVPSQHLRDTQATAFQRIFRVTGMCAEVYRATKQFEIVNAARRAFADRVEQQNRALASSFGLDLDAIKADALASSAEAKPADAIIPRD